MENQLKNPSIEESLAKLTTMEDQEIDHSIPICKELPLNVIDFILSKLPVKPLLRFKCVSKPWLSLISSPDFTKMHLLTNSSEAKRKIMFSFKGKYMDNFPLSDLLSTETIEPRSLNDVSIDAKFKKNAKIIGSQNGLICVFVPSKLLILWNPSIRKRSIVPDSDVASTFNKRSFGFGYDSDNNEYKIVGFFGSSENEYDPQLFWIAKVFSFKTGKWKRIKSNHCAGRFNEHNELEISYGGGKFYWLNYTPGGLGQCVNSLDLATEKYQSFEFPVKEMRMNCTMALSEQGLVHVLGCRDKEAEVWVMKEEGGKKKVSWTKVCTFEYEKVGLHDMYALFILNCHLFHVLSNGEIMMRHIREFMTYNPKDGSMRCCYIEGSGIDYGACNYVESLVWV